MCGFLGERAAKHILELDPKNHATYVALGNMYAAVGRFDASARVRKEMSDLGIKKVPEWSWIEVDGKVHSFVHGG